MYAPKHIDPDSADHDLSHAGALWQFHTARYSIALFAVPQDLNPADWFSDPRDVAFACQDDPAHWFCAVVAVYNENGDRVGMNTLGACSYNSFREFYSAHRWPRRSDGSRMDGHYFPDMVRAAIKEARLEAATASDGSRRA